MSATPSLTASRAQSIANGSPNPATRPRRTAGFGLPCARCRTYYAADLRVCPVCKHTERVSPTTVRPPADASPLEPAPDLAVLEQERERFLREFKAQLFSSQMQLHSAAQHQCIKTENHLSESEAAVICQSCYDHLQERVDVLEAALHLDLKEATQIVYDAVWADSSDPNKSYENAAHALLSELRKRSGVTPLVGLLKPLTE